MNENNDYQVIVSDQPDQTPELRVDAHIKKEGQGDGTLSNNVYITALNDEGVERV